MKKTISIIGSGPAALMLASTLHEARFSVTIYERNPAPARKFLVAGDGGLNLTHAEPMERFITRYTPASFLQPALLAFTNQHLQAWLLGLGIETRTGSSNKIYPLPGIKPIAVLNAILAHLTQKNVHIKTRHEWVGWNPSGHLLFRHEGDTLTVASDITVFALGGASWSITGSNGQWTTFFKEKKIRTLPFQASNAACRVSWHEAILLTCEGQALKNISVSCGTRTATGEMVITRTGLEGGAVYALSPELRRELNESQQATLYIDLKPTLSMEEIFARLSSAGNAQVSTVLKEQVKLNKVQLALLKGLLTREEYTNARVLSEKIKHLPVTVNGLAPIDESISTVGGIALDEVDETYQLKKLPGHYVIGEMLDWDAPTGGYLLQACFSMGHHLGTALNETITTEHI